MSVRGPDGMLHPARSLRALEHQSIRDFVQRAANEGYLSGHVLDYGAGRMPYAAIVRDAGGDYHAFDRTKLPASVAIEDLNPGIAMKAKAWDAILVNQVLQYVPSPPALLALFFRLLKHGGHLVITGKTNWPEVEPEDLGGLTLSGIRHLLRNEGFVVVECESRGDIPALGQRLSLGYGAVARRPRVLIYALLDPVSREPRYVGQTTTPPRKRLNGHVSEALRDKERPVSEWIRSLQGDIPEMQILEADPEDANEAERRWFRDLIREGRELLNASVGSRGVRTKPAKKRKPMSDEQRQKVGEFFRGRAKSPESNALRSIAASQRKVPRA